MKTSVIIELAVNHFANSRTIQVHSNFRFPHIPLATLQEIGNSMALHYGEFSVGEVGPLRGDCRLAARRSNPAWCSTTGLSAQAICPCLVPYTTPAPGSGWNSATFASSSSKWFVRLVKVPIRRISPKRHTAATGCCQGPPFPSPWPPLPYRGLVASVLPRLQPSSTYSPVGESFTEVTKVPPWAALEAAAWAPAHRPSRDADRTNWPALGESKEEDEEEENDDENERLAAAAAAAEEEEEDADG